MKTFFIIFILTFLIFSCKERDDSKLILAHSIRITYVTDFEAGTALSINNKGIRQISFWEKEFEKRKCYTDTLDSQSIDSINSYLKLIKKEKFHRYYGSHHQNMMM